MFAALANRKEERIRERKGEKGGSVGGVLAMNKRAFLIVTKEYGLSGRSIGYFQFLIQK